MVKKMSCENSSQRWFHLRVQMVSGRTQDRASSLTCCCSAGLPLLRTHLGTDIWSCAEALCTLQLVPKYLRTSTELSTHLCWQKEHPPWPEQIDSSLPEHNAHHSHTSFQDFFSFTSPSSQLPQCLHTTFSFEMLLLDPI